jgi:hypothetical protein
MTTFNGLQAPLSVSQGLNVSYTVPEGRVARVTVTLSVNARGSGGTVNTVGGQGSSDSATTTIVLPEGTLLSSSRTAASGTSSSVSANSVVTMTVNGSNSLQVNAGVHAVTNGGSISATGVASFSFYAEEYYG